MVHIPTLTTDRLILRPLELADADQLQAIFPRWEIVQYLNNKIPWPYPPDGSLTFFRDTAQPAMEAGKAWHWTLRPKAEPDRIIGMISLLRGEEHNRGFWIDPDWQRQGLMTEAVEAVTDFWFEALDQTVLRVPKAIANAGSRRISERSGMRLIRLEEHDFLCGRMFAEIWEITREEWRARGQRAARTSPGIPTILTERLILRPFELADADQIQAAFPRWEIVQYLNAVIPWPYPPDGALTFLRDRALPAMAEGKVLNWSLRPKAEPDRIIGGISLMESEGDNRGFWIDPAWRRQGLMTEAADAVTDFWFETLGRTVLRVPKAIANTGSRRISELSGMRVIRTEERDYVGGRMPAEIWEITREEWRARKR